MTIKQKDNKVYLTFPFVMSDSWLAVRRKANKYMRENYSGELVYHGQTKAFSVGMTELTMKYRVN